MKTKRASIEQLEITDVWGSKPASDAAEHTQYMPDACRTFIRVMGIQHARHASIQPRCESVVARHWGRQHLEPLGLQGFVAHRKTCLRRYSYARCALSTKPGGWDRAATHGAGGRGFYMDPHRGVHRRLRDLAPECGPLAVGNCHRPITARESHQLQRSRRAISSLVAATPIRKPCILHAVFKRTRSP